MKIIAGKWRGRRITQALKKNTRPTMSKVRAAFFSSLGERVVNSKFLDLFAGSGVMGLEAYSRGASTVVFVDNNREAVQSLKHLLQSWQKNDESTQAVSSDIERENLPLSVFFGYWDRVLSKLAKSNKVFDVIYVDPPYFLYEKVGFIVKLLTETLGNGLLAPAGVLVLEQRKKLKVPNDLGVPIKTKKYGSTQLVFVENSENSHI